MGGSDILCTNLPDCGAGKYLQGFNQTTGVKVCIQSVGLAQDCGDGEYMQGIDASGVRICKPLPVGVGGACAVGEILRGFNSGGNKICGKLKMKTETAVHVDPGSTYRDLFCDTANGYKVISCSTRKSNLSAGDEDSLGCQVDTVNNKCISWKDTSGGDDDYTHYCHCYKFVDN